MLMHHRLSTFVFLLALTLALPAWGQGHSSLRIKPIEGWSLMTGVGLKANPRGGGSIVGARYRHIYSKSDNVLFDGLYIEGGASAILSGVLRAGAHIEWLPIKILKLRLEYQLWGWLGLPQGRGHGLLYQGPDALYGEEVFAEGKGEEEPGMGHRLLLMPTLQLKLWRIVLLNELELAAWFIHGDEQQNGTDIYWLDPMNDTLVPRGTLTATLRNRPMLLFEAWKGSSLY